MYLRSLFVCFVTMLVAAPSWAMQQKAANDTADVIFRNGIHLRVLADDKTPTAVNRYLVVKGPDLVYRLFTDSQGHLLFGYDMTAFRSSRQGEIKIQVKPLDPEALSLFHPSDGNASREQLQKSTFEKELEMGAVPVGGTITVTTFTEPRTGHKITDVIQVVASENAGLNEQYPGELPSSPVPLVFDLANIHVWFNGKEITGSRPLRSVSGPYPVLYIPGHGSFFMALGPVPNLPFAQAGSIDGSKLEFTAGSDLILCKSSAPILGGQHQALLWIWHEPNYKLDVPQFNAFLGRPPEDRIQIAVADSMDVWRGLVFSPGGPF